MLLLNKVLLLASSLVIASNALNIQTETVSSSSSAGRPLERVTDSNEISSAGYPQEAFSQKSYPCIFKIGNEFYDFTPFKLAQNVWPAYWQNATNPTLSYQYEVGFCQLMSEANNATCTGTDSYAIGSTLNGIEFLLDKTGQPPTDCTPYSGSSSKSIEATTIEKTVINADTQEEEIVTGVQIKYSGGTCQSTGGSASFTVKAWCDHDIKGTDTEYNGEAYGDVCHPYIEMTSSLGGCDIFANSIIWEYLDQAKPYFGFAAIGAGVMLAFFGFRLIKPSICLAGFLTCTVAALLVFYAVYITSVDELATFYYWMGGGAVVGIIVGCLLAYCVKVGAAILAGWGGFALGLILNEAVMYHFEYTWIFWTTNVVCILGCAALTFKVFDHAMIMTTSVLGSYAIVRGVSCYVGHYYNEFTIIKLLKSGAIDEIDPYYWGYIGGFVAVSAIGAWYQFRMRPKPKPAHPYHH